MEKWIFILPLLIIDLFGISQDTLKYSPEELKLIVGKIELVKLLPSPTSKTNSFIQSVITDVDPYYFKKEYVSKPVLADTSDYINFLNLIYSDSVTNTYMRCYDPKHGLIFI